MSHVFHILFSRIVDVVLAIVDITYKDNDFSIEQWERRRHDNKEKDETIV